MFEWLDRPDARGQRQIQARFQQMLEDGRHVFDAAANALLGGTDPEVIREDLFQTDGRINRTEQAIRRLLIVHGTVHGAPALPEILVMMSLVKDAERIGDYAKNLYDLAVRAPKERDPHELARLIGLKDRISLLLVRARNLHAEEDEVKARAFLREAGELEDACDAAVHRLVGESGANHAWEVLAYRYLKRVASHASNVVTALVVPVDQLDFFDEPRIDPGPH